MPLAEKGNAKAQYGICEMYADGLGVAADVVEAFKWCQKSATQGDARALRVIGYFYEEGYAGLSSDNLEAMNWYRKAAKGGDAVAMRRIGLLYEFGKGGIKDDKEALSWYRKAALLGEPVAQLYLGRIYEFGEGVEQNSSEAMNWYRKAAKQGNANAQDDLIRMQEKNDLQYTPIHQPSNFQQKVKKKDQHYTAIISCGYGGKNFPLMACFEKSELKLSYNNHSMSYGVYEFATGNRPGDTNSNYALNINLPKHFHLVAENSHVSLMLSVKLIDSNGAVVFEDQARQWGSVNVKN